MPTCKSNKTRTGLKHKAQIPDERNLGLHTRRDIEFSRIERLNTVKMSALPKLIYRFNTILFKIRATFFCNHRQDNSKSHIERQQR